MENFIIYVMTLVVIFIRKWFPKYILGFSLQAINLSVDHFRSDRSYSFYSFHVSCSPHDILKYISNFSLRIDWKKNIFLKKIFLKNEENT